jgi:hypothetical protein
MDVCMLTLYMQLSIVMGLLYHEYQRKNFIGEDSNERVDGRQCRHDACTCASCFFWVADAVHSGRRVPVMWVIFIWVMDTSIGGGRF